MGAIIQLGVDWVQENEAIMSSVKPENPVEYHGGCVLYEYTSGVAGSDPQ